MGAISSFFLTPVFLIGLATASIPVIIHLLYRRRAPQVFFSTLRFLKICVMKTARRRRIENLLLLALRVMLLGLLSMALARPFLKSGAFGAEARSVVLVMQNSLSMACRHQGKSRYDAARDAALKVIQNLAPGDLATIVFTNGPASRKRRSLTHDREVLGVELAQSAVYAGPSSIPQAIEKARALLDEADLPNGEIYVFTDIQKTAWQGSVQDPDKYKVRAPIVLYDFGRSDFKDLAVTRLEFAGGARVAGSPVVIQVDVLNSSAEDHEASLSLYVEGQKRLERTVEVRSLATQTVSFQHTFERPGFTSGYVELEEDSLTLNNVRFFVADISPKLSVLIIKDQETAVPFLDSAFYLKKALNPFQGKEAERFSIQPKDVLLSDLKNEDIRSYDLVCLLGVSNLTVSEALEIQDYIEAGGSALFALGDASSSENYNTVFEKIRKSAGVLLPGRLLAPATSSPDRTTFLSVRQVDFEHPVFEVFRTLGISLFDEIHVYKYTPLAMENEPQARVLARLENNAPFLVEKRFGKGRLFLFTSTLDTSWNNFPLKNVYLPVVHSLTYYLAGKGALERNYISGDTVSLVFPQAKSPFNIELTDPTGASKQISSLPERPTEVTFDETFDLGIYRYRSSLDPPQAGAFAANFEPDSARLERLGPSQVEELLASASHYTVRDENGLKSVQATIRRGIGLEDIFLFAVLVIILIEGFAANRIRPPAKEPAPESALEAA